MGQNQPTIRLPFEYPKTPIEIHRDFTEVINNLPSAPTVFDAIIDPLASASSASHIYPNLTQLIAGETSWGSQEFTVGVHYRGTTQIVEPASPNISGKGALSLFGIGADFSAAPTLGWDFKAGLTCSLGQVVTMTNIWADPSVASAPVDQGAVTLINCRFGTNVTAPSGRSSISYNTKFATLSNLQSSGGAGITHSFFDCYCEGFTASSSLVTVYWIGGQVHNNVVSSIPNLVVHGVLDGTFWQITGGIIDINNLGSQNGPGLVISAGVSGTVDGPFAAITWSGTAIKRVFGINLGFGSNTDITGPAKIDVQQISSHLNAITLRGDGIQCHAHSIAAVTCIGLTNSQVAVDFPSGSGASFSLDAASSNNLVLLSGHHGASFGGITNLGTNNRIITEDSDTLISGATYDPRDFTHDFMFLGG